MIIDVHSHILPAIDDGSASVEESIAMLREEAKQGIHCVVATPHFYAQHDDPERFLSRRKEAWASLRRAIENYLYLPEIKLGAEVYYFRGMSDSDALQKLTIQDSPYILVEMPQAPWTDRMFDELGQIRVKQGLIPIVAHVDRYIAPFRTYGIPKRLEEMPVLVQANASFFLRRTTRAMALRMLKEEKIHLLGSDCHNMDFRPPCLKSALEIIERSLGAGALQSVYSVQEDIFR